MSENLINIFIASSAELKEEREKCIMVINQLNKSYQHLHLEPIEWEYDIVHRNYLEFRNIQDAINPKLKESNLAVFIFYSKIGKYTLEEFEYANKENKTLFAFFKSGFSPNRTTLQAYGELLDFKESLNDTLLYEGYANLTEFEKKLYANLNQYLAEKYSASKNNIASARQEAEVAERKRTNKIILSGQPLAQIEVTWEFHNVHQAVLQLMADADTSIQEDYELAYYNVPMRQDDYKFLNAFYKLYPFLNLISSDKEVDLEQEAGSSENVIALISLDNSQNSILPIGVLSEKVLGLEETKKSSQFDPLFSGGIKFYEDLDYFWAQTYTDEPKIKRSRKINDAPVLTAEEDKIIIKWLLDPFTFFNSVDRQNPNITLTANLPTQLKVIILNRIEQLPFNSNNLSSPEECYPWQVDNYKANFETDKFSSSLFSIVPNGLNEQAIKYKLQSLIKYQIQDFWGDDIPCDALMFVFDEIEE